MHYVSRRGTLTGVIFSPHFMKNWNYRKRSKTYGYADSLLIYNFINPNQIIQKVYFVVHDEVMLVLQYPPIVQFCFYYNCLIILLIFIIELDIVGLKTNLIHFFSPWLGPQLGPIFPSLSDAVIKCDIMWLHHLAAILMAPYCFCVKLIPPIVS